MPFKKLGKLEEYILRTCFQKTRLAKREIFKFYNLNHQDKKSKKYQKAHIAIIKCINSLINKGYLNGYGYRSPKEWHFNEVRLTPEGKEKVRRILSIRKLPLGSNNKTSRK